MVTVGLNTYVNSVQHMGGCVGSAGKQITSKWYAGATMAEKGTVHDIQQEATNHNQIDTANINSISFNNK